MHEKAFQDGGFDQLLPNGDTIVSYENPGWKSVVEIRHERTVPAKDHVISFPGLKFLHTYRDPR